MVGRMEFLLLLLGLLVQLEQSMEKLGGRMEERMGKLVGRMEGRMGLVL
jgi:hypothetical protein